MGVNQARDPPRACPIKIHFLSINSTAKRFTEVSFTKFLKHALGLPGNHTGQSNFLYFFTNLDSMMITPKSIVQLMACGPDERRKCNHLSLLSENLDRLTPDKCF